MIEELKPRFWERVTRKQFLHGAIGIFMIALVMTCIITILTRSTIWNPKSGTGHPAQFAQNSNHLVTKTNDVQGEQIFEECHFNDEILSMAKGIDITRLDLLPMSLKGIEGNPGIKSQLIKLTCERKFSKLDSAGNLISRIPDQFMPNSYETMSAFGASVDTEEHTERSTRDSKMSLGLTVGIEILKLGMFSSSVSYENKRQKIVTRESYFSELNVFSLVRSAEFRSPKSRSLSLEGNDDFQSVVDSLPFTFEENPSAYLDLLDKYGTHYFSIARFGGFVKIRTEVTKRLRQTMSEDEIQSKLKLSYKMLFKGSMNFDLFENVTSHEFMGMTNSAKYSHGGDPSLAFSGDLEKWIRTVPNSARLIGGKLQPITTLVNDPLKALGINRAISVYLAKAYVKDLKACLRISLVRGTGDVSHQRKLLASLSAIALEQLQDEDSLTALGTEVSQSLQQPSYGPVTLTIFRVESIVGEAIDLGEHCLAVDIGIFGIMGNKNMPKFIQKLNFKTSEVSGKEVEWNEQIQLTLDYAAAVQFCLNSRTCDLKATISEPTTSMTPTSTQILCAHFITIFVPLNRHEGVQNSLRFGDMNLIYNIYWEPLDGADRLETKPV